MTRSSPALAIVAILLLAASVASAQDPAAEGGVNEVRGTASYRVPIVVPPGPAGHTPEVALVYSTEKVNGGAGWMGVGWSLAGASVIERDRKLGVPYNYEASCGSSFCYQAAEEVSGVRLFRPLRESATGLSGWRLVSNRGSSGSDRGQLMRRPAGSGSGPGRRPLQ